jgi:Ca2+-binding EF-hand superfamily protein
MLQRLMRSGEENAATTPQELQGARQSMPGGGGGSCQMNATGAAQMSGGTMSGMIALQTECEDAPSMTDELAQRLIDSLDTDDDGKLSAEEIDAAFKAAGLSSDDGSGFASVDADGDGAITATELGSAIETAMQAHGPRGGPHGPPPGGPQPSGEETATSLVSAFDTDQDGGLSLAEITSALGIEDDDDGAASAFTSLDADGDGVLSSAEIASAVEARMAQGVKAYAQSAALAA